jgi:hypothetical protein
VIKIKLSTLSIERKKTMELNTILLIAAVLICPISMGIVMWKMNKNMDNRHMHTKSDDSAHAEHIKKSEK